jgi:polysaccharide deacetylase family protein (PEP-CTERM system associated)
MYQTVSHDKTFLFAIDLEDIRLMLTNGSRYKERVPDNTYKYLEWLKKYNANCTFFITGNVAIKYPSLINEIIKEGHEVACHTNNHTPLYRFSPEEFKKDLFINKNILLQCGAASVEGFRAPIYSLTEKTSWAYNILKEAGFTYSSSVLPTNNPLHGWKNFSKEPVLTASGIIELPITVAKTFLYTMPVCGGIYFRNIPLFLLKKNIRSLKERTPLVAYLHPYDIDTEQEYFMHPEINNNKLYNYLMYRNRSKTFNRLDYIMTNGYKIITYKKYLTTGFKK